MVLDHSPSGHAGQRGAGCHEPGAATPGFVEARQLLPLRKGFSSQHRASYWTHWTLDARRRSRRRGLRTSEVDLIPYAQDQAPRAAATSPLMVTSVHKAFRVLSAFSRTEPRLTLKQIAHKLAIDKSTAQRFIHTLISLGYLSKDPVTKILSVTVSAVSLAHVYLSTNPLITAAMPSLVQLGRETGETVNLVVLDGSEAVFVSRILGKHLLSTGVMIGTRIPAFASAAGLAMMAALPQPEVERLLEETALGPFTSQTVHEPSQILERLSACRAKGYAISVGDYIANDLSLGACVSSQDGRLAGAISLSVSADRFTPKEIEGRYARLVAAAAGSVVV